MTLNQVAFEPKSFDYNALAGETLSKVRQHTQDIKENLQETITIIWELGRKLFEVYNLLKPRSFKKWILSEFGWSRPTAYYNYINVYTAFPDLVSIKDLPIDPAALYRLATPELEIARAQILERAENGQRITLEMVKTVIGGKTKKPVTSQVNSIDDKKMVDAIVEAGEKETPENYIAENFPNTATIDIVAQTMLPANPLAEAASMSSQIVEETPEEITFVPSEIGSTATTKQINNASDSSSIPTFTPDSSSTTNYSHSATTYAYNTCQSLVSNLEHLNQEEAVSILRAFLEKFGFTAIGNFVKQLQPEEIVSLCNQCLTFLNERGVNWWETKKINFAVLSDTAIKSLSLQLKRILISRGTQQLAQNQTQSELTNLVYISARG